MKAMRMVFHSFLVLGCLGGATMAVAEQEHEITVSARGEVSAIPDVAIISGRIVEEADDPDTAVSNARRHQGALASLIQRWNLEDRFIRISDVSVAPVWDYDRQGGRTLRGHVAEVSVMIKVTELSLVGSLTGDLLDSGVNEMNPVQFEFSQRRQLELDAIRDAMIYAGMQVEVALSALGQQRGALLNSQVSVQGGMPQFAEVKSASRSSYKSESADPVVVSPGEQKITADVTTTFRIEK